ncbi:hypothetical protein JOM56_009047, partial [Amanita muscaria]
MIQEIGTQCLEIPNAYQIQSTLLPAAGLSINDMLDFPLPKLVPSQSLQEPIPYLRREPSDPLTKTCVLSLRHLPIPTASVITELSRALPQAWIDGYESIQYAHLPGKATTHFPLWVITFWSSVVKLRGRVRKYWHNARLWLERQMRDPHSPERRRLAREANDLLALLPWNRKKAGAVSDDEPDHQLWRYLSDEWLRSDDENDMLEVLRRAI